MPFIVFLKKYFITGIMIIFFIVHANISMAYEKRQEINYLPDTATFQTAGYTGYASVFIGYQFLNSRLETVIGYGYVPQSIGGKEIHTLALRSSFFPFRMNVKNTMTINPVYIGITILCAMDKNLYWQQSTDCPDNYYQQTGTHAAINAGIQLIVNGLYTNFRHGFYMEITMLDSYASVYFGRNNYKHQELSDYVTMALGYKIIF